MLPDLRLTIPAIAATVAIVAASADAHARPLSAYAWKNRPLLIFAASERSSQLKRQRAIVATNRAGLRERDMVVIEIVGARVRTVLGRPSARASAAAFRSYYGVPSNDFRAILVGKDGGLKLASRAPVGTGRLFPLIDSMPMRQQEMRRRR